MAIVRAEAEAVLPSPPEATFRLLSDLDQRPRILPPAFTDFHVDTGAAEQPVISYRLIAGGRSRGYRMRVVESAPGLLTESDLDSTLVTTYTVSPSGTGSRVQISTTWEGAKGIGGFFERTFAPRVLTKLYLDELRRLAVALAGTPGQGSTT